MISMRQQGMATRVGSTMTRIIGVVLVSVGALCCPESARADDDFSINWYTIDGGGAMLAAAGDFELSGTIGQLDASVSMAGGDFEITGGFWVGAVADPFCFGDLDENGEVDLNDLATLLGRYGTTSGMTYADGDLDDDGDIDLDDLAYLLGLYGTICP